MEPTTHDFSRVVRMAKNCGGSGAIAGNDKSQNFKVSEVAVTLLLMKYKK
jgi:hypothetical protein